MVIFMKKCFLTLVLLFAYLSPLVAIIGYSEEKSGFHYYLKTKISPAEKRLEAEVWIEHPPALRFYLHPEMVIRRVEANGKSVPFHPAEDAPPLDYSVGKAMDVVAENIQRLHIQYAGTIGGVVNGVNLISADLVELAWYSAWYPAFQGMHNCAFDMEVSLPSGFPIVSNGLLKNRVEKNGYSLTQWRSHQPGFDMVLLASPKLHQIKARVDGLLVEMCYGDLPAKQINVNIDGLAGGIQSLARYYGRPRVKGVLRFAYSPRDGWGYSRLPLFVVSEKYARQRLQQENGEARVFQDNCHEMAHF